MHLFAMTQRMRRCHPRLRLRANNAATRLTPLAIEAGCVGPERQEWFDRRESVRAAWNTALDREVAALELERAGLPVRRDAGEHRLLLLEIPEHRVAEHVPAVARVVAGRRSRLHARRRQVHQPVRLRDRQAAQQHGVEKREDRRVGPYAERQRNNGDRGDERGAEQRPEGQPDVERHAG